MDPVTITIGSMAVAAFSEAAKIIAKKALESAVGEATKDAYTALKAKIAKWAAGDVAALEKSPDSTKRQELLAEEIDKQSAHDLAEIKTLADALINELRKQPPAVGVDIGRLEAMRIRLGEITVTEGVGFRAGEVVTPGEFSLDKLTVGGKPGKN